MIQPILPAILDVRDDRGRIDTDQAVRQNVHRVVSSLRNDADPPLLNPQREGKLKIVGAHYNLGEGLVEFFDRP